jgi:hypothetical protein
VRRLDGSSGDVVWDFPLNGAVLRSAPVVSGSAVVLGLRDGALVALDGDEGEQVFRGPPGPGLIGPIAVTPELLVAVRGGREAGLVAFEHDPSRSIERVPSPSDPDPVALVSSFAAATAALLLVLLLPARMLAVRRGPAFDDEFGEHHDGPHVDADGHVERPAVDGDGSDEGGDGDTR